MRVAGPFARVVLRRLLRPLPLVHTLLLSIETHALCGALAFFAMLGFYPLSVLLISLAKYVLRSPDAHEVVRLAVQSYYPAGQEFVLRNLEASSWQFRGEISISLALWIFLGGAGIFIPLEMAFNRLWGFAVHRAYWHNQLVGLLLTAACWAIAVVLVLGVSQVPRLLRAPALWLAVLLLTAVALFLAYRLLPHGPVPGGIALGAAALTAGAGEVVRWVFLLVLPWLDLSRSHGPFQVSVSFLLFAYVEAYVLLAGAFLAAEATREQQAPREGVKSVEVGEVG
ncbi:MAG: YhjD/YihY/BrkB family envelope integrity protein [Betaproteobacteria bacterium]